MAALSAHLNDASARCVSVTATSWSEIQPASHRDKVVRDRRDEKSPSYRRSSGNC